MPSIPEVLDALNPFKSGLREATIESDGVNYEVFQQGKKFNTEGIFPPAEDVERLSRYYRGRKTFDGNLWEIYDRASDLLKDTPHAKQLKQLYIAVNIMDVLLTKPADMLVGEPPTYESGEPDDSEEQKSLNRIVEDNDLNLQIHESVIGAGYRGDSFFKTFFDYRQDFSGIGHVPVGVKKEPIIEAVNPSYVFPELSKDNAKKFKAINIAFVEWVYVRGEGEKPFLNVERHLPGYIQYEKFALHPYDVDNSYGAPIQRFIIGEKVATGKNSDIVETGVPRLLVFHSPYKTTDDAWEGISGIQKIESVLAAINDLLVQLDFILHKHSDPTAYGPDLPTDTDGSIRFGGKYIPVNKDEQTPGYMTFLSSQQLDGVFRELDMLLSLVYQMSETPQWLFGTTVAGQEQGGTGTSHTDGAAIRARFMPILSKVRRIRVHVDRAIRDALWTAMELENYANDGVDGFTKYDPVYPKITWRDGLPRSEKEEAEIAQLRTGGKPTLDVQSAIKRLDNLDDMQAQEIIDRIHEDEKTANGFVDASIFSSNGAGGGK
jgi:hypothetical protein